MAISFFGIEHLKNYVINHYKHERIALDHILVTSFHGGWCILSDQEFKLLKTERIEEDPNLFKRLEEQGIILTRNNESSIIEAFRRRKSYLMKPVTLHIITVTLRCNHKCIYCHALSRPMNEEWHDMSKETAKKVVDFIFQSPSKSIDIEFQGGEPLLNFPVIKFIIEYAKKVNEEKKRCLKFNLVSNLTLMTDEILEFLIENKVHICTSLDGPKEVHDKNRKYLNGGSSYEDVVNWIKKIRERGYPIGVLQTTTRFSLPHYKEIIDEYRRLGISSIRMRQLNNAGMAKRLWKTIGYTPQEYLEFWKNCLEYIIELNRKGIRISEEFTVMAARKLLTKDYIGYTCWGFPCGAALTQCGYDQNGNIFCCDEARSFEEFKIGDVNQTYKEVFTGGAASNIISASSGFLTKCSECTWYPFCGSCVVCTYGQQGNPIGDMNIDNECIIRKGILEHTLKKMVFSEDRKIILGWVFPDRNSYPAQEAARRALSPKTM